MKTLASVFAFIFLVGCSTTQTPNGSGSRILTPQRVQAIATLAAFAGARVDLQAHPERRPAYVIAHRGLESLMKEEVWNPDAAAVVLSDALIGSFNGSEGSVAILGGLALTDALGLGEFDARRFDHAVALITGLEAGMRRALASPVASRSGPDGADTLEPIRSAAVATRLHPTIK